jgi:hypothetical protein
MFRIGIAGISIESRRSILDTETMSKESVVSRIGIENRHFPNFEDSQQCWSGDVTRVINCGGRRGAGSHFVGFSWFNSYSGGAKYLR